LSYGNNTDFIRINNEFTCIGAGGLAGRKTTDWILAIVAIVLLIMLALGLFAAVLGTETSVSDGSVAMAFGGLL